MWRAGVAVVGVTACVKIAPFHDPGDGGTDAPGDGGADVHCPAGATVVSQQDDPSHPLICGPGYAVRFSPDGVGFPSSLVIGAHPVLGGGEGCIDERAIGIALRPAGIIDGESIAAANARGTRLAAMSHTNQLEIAQPYLTKEVVTWTASLDCGVALAGRQAWTFFPNGRIVRFDHVTITTNGVGGASCTAPCTEATSSDMNWYPRTYTALIDEGEAVANAERPAVGSASAYDGVACVDGSDYHFGIAIGGTNPKYLLQPSATALAFAYDAGMTGTLETDTIDNEAVYLVSPTVGCDIAQVQIYSAPYELSVNDVPIEPEFDGIYGGDHGGPTGLVGYDLANDTVVLKLPSGGPSIPAQWAVALRFGDPHQHGFAITDVGGNPLEAPDVEHTQIGTSGALHVFYFQNALTTGDQITITPNP